MPMMMMMTIIREERNGKISGRGGNFVLHQLSIKSCVVALVTVIWMLILMEMSLNVYGF